jgi:hypothetical protein
VSASQHDTGEQRQSPEPPQPIALSPPSSPAPPAPTPPSSPAPPAPTPPSSPAPPARTLRRPYLLLTFRPPRRPQPDSEPLPGDDPSPVGEPLPASESQTDGEPLSGSGPVSVSEHRPGGDPSPPLTQARISGNARAGIYATRWLDASLILIGAALFLCALATLSTTWAWSWRAGSDRTFNLAHMHGICTSAMGELAQGASGTVASHCLWVDGTWTEAVALTGGGCILAVIGVVRTVSALRTPS